MIFKNISLWQKDTEYDLKYFLNIFNTDIIKTLKDFNIYMI